MSGFRIGFKKNWCFSLLFARISNRFACKRISSHVRSYSVSSHKATKNANFSLNPIPNPDTYDALLMITYHDFSIHFLTFPKISTFARFSFEILTRTGPEKLRKTRQKKCSRELRISAYFNNYNVCELRKM